MIINFGAMSYPISNNSVDGGMTDLKGDMMEDFIALGIIFTVNCYIALILCEVIEGIDGFILSLTGMQAIGMLFGISLFQLMVEIYVRHIKTKLGFVFARLMLGGTIIFVSYTLCLLTGGTSGYDDRIREMSAWDYHNLLGIEFMYFCIVVILGRVRRRKSVKLDL